MPYIDPKRLIQLRKLKGLSRQALHAASKVSVRTIARIEASDGPYGVREVNLHRLAKAFDLTPDVVTGEAPLPDGLDEDSTGSGVHPQVLRALREQQGMTRAKLAEESGLRERLIAGLESSAKMIESTKAEDLAKALGTDQETLSKLTAKAPSEPNTGIEPMRTSVGMSTQLRLAYDLISLRYGPTRAQIIQLAPLLFALLAEGCLAWRRKRLDEAEEAARRLRELSDGGSQLYFTHYLVDVDYGVALESESIESADLLGRQVRDDDWARMNFGGDLDEVTPFSDYLCKLADDLAVQGIVDFWPTESESVVGLDLPDEIWGAEPYQVCGAELTELTAGSKHARWALAFGDAQLSKMPRTLFETEAVESRVKWLEDHLSDEVRQELERRESWLEEMSKKVRLDKANDGPDRSGQTEEDEKVEPLTEESLHGLDTSEGSP